MHTQEIIMHIGMSKCASTYLQKIVFPRFGNYSNIAFAPAHEKYHVFRPDMQPTEYRDIVSRHIINPDPDKKWLIISCEDYAQFLFRGFEQVFNSGGVLARDKYHFSNKIIAANLARTYPSARIIIVIREQISWSISRYKMNYRGGKTSATIDALMAEPLEGYDILIKRYQDLFGKNNVLVLPYEMLARDSGEFCRRITGFISPDTSPGIPDDTINVAPDLCRTVEYERLKNSWRLGIRRAAWLTPAGQFCTRLFARLLVGCLKPWFYLRYGSRKYSVYPQAETIAQLRPLLAESNRNTVRLTGLNLQEYGYFLD